MVISKAPWIASVLGTCRPLLLTFVILFPTHLWASQNIIVYPLVNNTQNPLVDYVSYALCEGLSRVMGQSGNVQVWDPLLLVSCDSMAARMENDSLLSAMQYRFKSDAIIGGSLNYSGDTLIMFLKVYHYSKDALQRDSLIVRTTEATLPQTMVRLFPEILGMVTSASSAILFPYKKALVSSNQLCYATYLAGYGAMLRNSPENALSAFSRALFLDPGCAYASYRMGCIYRDAHDGTHAKDCFVSAVTQAPDDPVVLAGRVSFAADFESAEVCARLVEKNRQLLSSCCAGYLALGKAVIASGEYTRAISLLTRAIALGPQDLAPLYALGNAYQASGESVRAADIFNQLVAMRPNYSPYLLLLGTSYRASGNLMESAQILSLAHALAPDNSAVSINLAHTYLALGFLEQCGELLIEAHKRDPESSEIAIALGVLFWKQGKKQESQQLFTQASKSKSDAQYVANNQGTAFFISGSYKKALECFSSADRMGKKNTTILCNAGNACMALLEWKKAKGYFDQVIALSPHRIDVLLILAHLAVKMNDGNSAENYYRQILSVAPSNAQAMVGRAMLLSTLKQFDEATDICERFLEQVPRDITVRLAEAAVYAARGWFDVSLAKYNALLQDGTAYKEAFLGKAHVYAMNVIASEEPSVTHIDSSLALLAKSQVLEPTQYLVDFDLARVYKKMKKPQRSEVYFAAALAKCTDPLVRKEIDRARRSK